MKIPFSGIMLLFYSLIFAQQKEVEQARFDLASIKNQRQAEKYLKENATLKGTIITIDPKKDSSATAKNLLTKKQGEIIATESTDGSTIYLLKILKTEKIVAYRVQYIFFDQSKLSMSKIESTRKLILKRLESGESFDQMAREYSMDMNATEGGDIGWFEENQMVNEFETAVKSNDFGKVFMVDVPDQKWYYIVKNTYQPREDYVSTGIFIEIKK